MRNFQNKILAKYGTFHCFITKQCTQTLELPNFRDTRKEINLPYLNFDISHFITNSKKSSKLKCNIQCAQNFRTRVQVQVTKKIGMTNDVRCSMMTMFFYINLHFCIYYSNVVFSYATLRTFCWLLGIPCRMPLIVHCLHPDSSAAQVAILVKYDPEFAPPRV